MKPEHTFHTGFPLAIFLAFAWNMNGVVPAAGGEADWKQVTQALGLLPDAESPYGAAGPDGLEDQSKRKLSSEELALLSRDSGGGWKEFSDDLISFELPDDPLLKVDAFTPSQRPLLRIVGGAVGTTDNSFQKVYRITFSDGAPYGMVLVAEEDWFDEGICLCGPIDLKTLVYADGNLLELSQLPGGSVKKFQVINGTHRAILFEWTHSAITQSAYSRIGASLRLKEKSDRTTEEWIELTKEKRRFHGLIGWLRIGAGIDETLKLLGTPSERATDHLVYVIDERSDDGRGWRGVYTLPFEEGRLTRFAENWSSYEELQAPRGTAAWIEDTLRAWSDKARELPEGQSPELPPDDVALIWDQHRRNAKDAAGDDWDFWCGVVSQLAELGVRDPEAVGLVERRCHDMALPQWHARWVLEHYESPELDAFVRERLRFLMGDSEAAAQWRGECRNLFSSLVSDDDAAVDLLREGAAHPAALVRGAAVCFAYRLPIDEAKQCVRRALSDPDKEVRWGAILNVRRLFTQEDKAWLEGVLALEDDEMCRKTLAERISRLR